MARAKWLKGYFFPTEHKALLYQLIKREVRQKFQGSWLGLGWAILTPIAMLAVYTFVFRTVLKAKWPGDADASNAEFALQIFSGLLVFTLFSEVVGRAPTLVSQQPNMVKKVVFPLPVLAWVSVGASSFYAGLSLLVLLVAAFFCAWRTHHSPGRPAAHLSGFSAYAARVRLAAVVTGCLSA